MPATAPIDREVLANLRLGDEQALERLFRTTYPQLTDRARAELDDPACAPRVVEGAFLRAWAERAQFETPESLERFLQRSVHEGAVREKSRRAALHRFEQREGVKPGGTGAHHAAADVPVDTAWAHVSAILHAPPVDAEHDAHVRHEHSRHEAAQHMAAVAKRPPWVAPVAIAVVLAALFTIGMRWMDRAGGDVAINSALSSPDLRVRVTRPGERAALTLTDGSRAVLGADSKLSIPPTYGERVRALSLEGAASFTVQDGAARPFHVRTPQAMVSAVGTAFDVRAFPKDGITQVRVREGSVTVKAREGDDVRTLAPGAVVEVRGDGSVRDVPEAARNAAFAWADNRLVLRERPLREAVAEAQRWFGLTLVVRDSALLSRPVSVDAELGASRALLAQLEQSGRLSFGYEDQRMVLRDAGDSKAAVKR
jgi:ferric-dicitrate binding protein FerR (iron transport regulator)